MSEKKVMRFYVILSFFLACLQFSCQKDIDFHSLAFQNQNLSSQNLSSQSLNILEKENFQLKSKAPLLDLLIVADTSGSMYHHLKQLGLSLNDLLSEISNYDWQIGIISADHGDHKDPSSLQQNWQDYTIPGRFGSLMPLENGSRLLNTKILTPQTPNYEKIFLHSLSHIPDIECHRPPYCSNYLEQPLRSLETAIKRSSLDNHSFFRPQADFISLIITNEEERKEDTSRATSAQNVVNRFLEHFPQSNKRFIAYNIIVTDSSCLNSERARGGTAQIAHSIAKLAEITKIKGANISICHQNYGSKLRKISEHIKYQLENTVSLKKEPLPESVQVHFLKGPILNWKLSGRNIIFESESTTPSSVVVTYQEKKDF